MENRNNTSFPKIVNEYVKSLGDPGDLRKHQQITSAYAQISTGVLAMHGLGSGKTRLAVSVMLRAAEDGRPVIFLTNKSLHDNMRKELDAIYKANPEQKKINISFVTMNASNMITQLRRVLNLEDGAVVRLEGRTLVVDEAHNLFNSITNGSENSLELYSAIMGTRDLKTLFLTATPMVNSPFEIAVCYNMLARSRVLPESYEDFNRFFVLHGKVRNGDKFKSRIIGLTSYFGDFFTGFKKLSEVVKRPDFPDQKPIQLVECPMSYYQYGNYYIARGIEQSEASYANSATNLLQKPSGSSSSSYRVLSRQISNVVPPQDKIKTERGRLRLQPYDFGAISDDLENHSPKLVALRKNLKQTGKHLIYSSFVEQGINLIADMLSHDGYRGVTLGGGGGGDIDSDLDAINVLLTGGGGGGSHKYIVITGETKVEERQALVQKYNTDDSIKVILVSGAGSEGLDLKGIQYVHMFEPYWNFLRLQQVIGRAVRWKSHMHMKSKDRWVQPYLYMATYPEGLEDRLTKTELTTNMDMYTKSRETNKLIQQFYKLMAEASIECDFFNKNPRIRCFVCAPTDRELFLPNIYKDMNYPVNCQPPEEEEVDAEEFMFQDKRYAKYKNNGKTVYLVYRDDLGGFIEAPMGDPIYMENK